MRVGKTAVVYEAVHRLIEGKAPETLQGVGVWQISGGRLMAGMKYLGEWQERVLELIADIKTTGGIIFAENLIELLETSGTERHAEGIPGLLLPHILSGDVVMITEAQPEQLARAEQSHPSFLRAFRRLLVEPMSPARSECSTRSCTSVSIRREPVSPSTAICSPGRSPGASTMPTSASAAAICAVM